MSICLRVEQLKIVEQYAKSKGLLNAGQAIEQLMKCCPNQQVMYTLHPHKDKNS
jgi:hypothetical protein